MIPRHPGAKNEEPKTRTDGQTQNISSKLLWRQTPVDTGGERAFPCFFGRTATPDDDDVVPKTTKPSGVLRLALLWSAWSLPGNFPVGTTTTRVRSNQDLIWCVKIGVHIVFCVHRGS